MRILPVVIFAVVLLFGIPASGQSVTFKHELLESGLALLKKGERTHSQESLAFAAAAALDPSALLDQVIRDCEFDAKSVFESCVDHDHLFPDAERALKYLGRVQLKPRDGYLLAEFAYKLGRRHGDLDRLLRLSDSCLKIQPTKGPLKDVPADQVFRQRVSELSYLFQRGRLETAKEGLAFESVSKGIVIESLQQQIFADWVYWTSQFDWSVQEILTQTGKIQNKSLAESVLVSVLKRSAKRKEVKPLTEAEETLLEALLMRRNKKDAGMVADAYEFEFQTVSNPTPMSLSKVDRDGLISLMVVRSKNEESHLKLLKADKDLSFIDGLFRASKKREMENRSIRNFDRELRKIPAEEQAEWIPKYVLIYGWKNRSLKVGEFPEEGEILAEFEQRINDAPALARTLQRNIDSFTPPTPASRELMLRMLHMLPKKHWGVTMYELESLVERISAANGVSLSELEDECLVLIDRARRNRDIVAWESAYAFCKRGQQQAVLKFLQLIEDPSVRVMAMFKCSMAFPPAAPEAPDAVRTKLNRLPGGLF